MSYEKPKQTTEDEKRLTAKYGKLKFLKTSDYLKSLTQGESK